MKLREVIKKITGTIIDLCLIYFSSMLVFTAYTGDVPDIRTVYKNQSDILFSALIIINQIYYIIFFYYKKRGTIGLKFVNLNFKKSLSLSESFIYGIISLLYLLFPILLLLVFLNKGRKLFSEMAVDEALTPHETLPNSNIKLAIAFNALIIFISVFVIIFAKVDVINLYAKLSANSRISGTQLSGFWYSYNEGECFNNGNVFYIDEKGLHKINNGNIELFLPLEKIEYKNNQAIFHEKKAIDKNVNLLIYEDKGFEIFLKESRHKGNVWKAKGSAFFSVLSMRQCRFPIFGGIISGIWHAPFQPLEVKE